MVQSVSEGPSVLTPLISCTLLHAGGPSPCLPGGPLLWNSLPQYARLAVPLLAFHQYAKMELLINWTPTRHSSLYGLWQCVLEWY